MAQCATFARIRKQNIGRWSFHITILDGQSQLVTETEVTYLTHERIVKLVLAQATVMVVQT